MTPMFLLAPQIKAARRTTDKIVCSKSRDNLAWPIVVTSYRVGPTLEQAAQLLERASSLRTSAALLPTFSTTSASSSGKMLSFLAQSLTCFRSFISILDRSGGTGLVKVMDTAQLTIKNMSRHRQGKKVRRHFVSPDLVLIAIGRR